MPEWKLAVEAQTTTCVCVQIGFTPFLLYNTSQFTNLLGALVSPSSIVTSRRLKADTPNPCANSKSLKGLITVI